MRVLITSTPGLGHVLPVVPLAVELQRQGHVLHWVAGPGSDAAVAEAGIEVTVAGMPERERMAEIRRRHPGLWARPIPEARFIGFGANFGELAAPSMIEALRPVVADWRPDVIVHEAAELAAPLVAAAAGIPSACHGFGELVPEAAVRRAGMVMAPRWEQVGLPPDPYAGSYRGLYIDIYPPSLRTQDMTHVPRALLRRPASGTPASGSLVYVTFGTVFNHVDDGFRAAVRGAAAVVEEVLVTVGPTGDPDAVGEVPDNVRVERFVPQADVLPRCAAVVCHGGSGTVLASLAHGIPLLCLPRGADQFDNASNAARLGAGTVLRPEEVTEAAVRAAIDHMVRSPDMATAARSIAAEIAAMPSDAEVVAALEELAVRG